MAEYIKRDDALRELEQINPVDYGAMWDYEAHHYVGEGLRDCKEAIEGIQTADVAPVVHARWVKDEDGEWSCTNCREAVAICDSGRERTYRKPYCPNCGAKMDGGDDNALN